MNTLKRYGGCIAVSVLAHALIYISLNSYPTSTNSVYSVCFWGYILTYAVSPHKGEGDRWNWLCNHSYWKKIILSALPKAKITSQAALNHNQHYIFAAFPHGTASVNHIMTMTDGLGFLSKIHQGERRDLAASVLFYVPIIREILLWLGNVDASSTTAKIHLNKKRSLLIFVGGEKEQLMTQPGMHRVFCKNRLGFVKLALTYGAPLVPLYTFGENECYHIRYGKSI